MDLISALTLLKSAGNSEVIRQLIPFFIAWFLVRKEIRKQFKSLNDSISVISTNFSVLSDKLITLQSSHDSRLKLLEEEFKSIKTDCIKCSPKE